MKICNILTDYLTNPIGIDIINPRILWNLEDVKKQTAFEINYTVNGIKKTTGVIESNLMYYDFQDNFKSRDHIEFEITIYENKNKVTSEKNFFEIGLLNKNDWKANFISGNYKVSKKKRYPVDYFKKNFKAENIKSSRLYISSLGVYEAYLNGARVGNFVMAPGSTDYRKRVQYQTYDVTNLLKNGDNEFIVLLADGWYRGSIGAKGFSYIFGKETAFIAQLEMKDIADNISYVLSNETWKWSNDGPIRFADFKDGEHVDSRMEPTYNKKAKISHKNVNLTASNNTFAKEQEVFNPISKRLGNNTQIFEFEQNLAGYLSFEVEAEGNEEITVTLGEMLDSNNELTLHNIQCNTRGRLSPLQEVHYICHKGHNIYQPKFMYAGFRYASFKTSLDIKIKDVKQIALYTDLKSTSKFECSNELINIFNKNTLWSLKSNSFDVPTDCPTRERMGWTGDSQVFFNSASFLTNYAAFSRKHLKDIYDRQNKKGRLPQIAPYNAEDWFMDVMNGSVGWADAGILIPYRFYKKYGDIRILNEYYDKMVKYANFMISRLGNAKGLYSVYSKPLHLSKENKKFGVNTGQSYGEWAEPNDVKAFVWTDFACPHPEESMAYTSYILALMVEISKIVGHNENIERFKYYSEGVKKAYQELVTKPKFSLDTNRQAKLVRPLYMRLLNESQEEYAKKRLIEALDFYKWRLGTGFLSTPFILDVLATYDIDACYKLLENEEMPGWLYMAKNNTGTIWEGWEGPNAKLGISSLNHYSKGALVEWLYHSMCGINISGINHFTIKPIIGGNISFANASYDSIYGTISVKWERINNKVIFDLNIPANTKAKFIYNNISKEYESGTYHIEMEN